MAKCNFLRTNLELSGAPLKTTENVFDLKRSCFLFFIFLISEPKFTETYFYSLKAIFEFYFLTSILSFIRKSTGDAAETRTDQFSALQA